MEHAYTIEEELVITERADLVVRGLTSGVVKLRGDAHAEAHVEKKN
jgi:hypothetical protein